MMRPTLRNARWPLLASLLSPAPTLGLLHEPVVRRIGHVLPHDIGMSGVVCAAPACSNTPRRPLLTTPLLVRQDPVLAGDDLLFGGGAQVVQALSGAGVRVGVRARPVGGVMGVVLLVP